MAILRRRCGFPRGTASDGDTGRADVLLAAIPRTVEIAEPNFARKDERRDGTIHTLSRIDRISSAELRDFQCHAHSMGSVGDRSAPSDHIPVRFTIVCPRVKQQDHPVTQRWLAQHPLFITALDEEHRNKMYEENPFIALNQFKEVAFSASTKARKAMLTNTPTTQGAKLLVACTALRAYRNGLTNTIRQCCETWDPVAQCFDSS